MIHEKTAKIQKYRDCPFKTGSSNTTEPILIFDIGRLTAEGRNPSGKDFVLLARLGEEFK
jgi:hypothetical protein